MQSRARAHEISSLKQYPSAIVAVAVLQQELLPELLNLELLLQ